jgi:hypothetical protein
MTNVLDRKGVGFGSDQSAIGYRLFTQGQAAAWSFSADKTGSIVAEKDYYTQAGRQRSARPAGNFLFHSYVSLGGIPSTSRHR